MNKHILALRYAIALMLSCGVIFWIADKVGIHDATWILISAAVCTEIDAGKAYQTTLWRIVSTSFGVAVSFIMLNLCGVNMAALALSILVTALMCNFFFPKDVSWKLAPVTCILVIVSSLPQHSLAYAESLGLRRAGDVILGSIISALIALIGNFVWIRVEKLYTNSK